MKSVADRTVIEKLQKKILALQGVKNSDISLGGIGLGIIENSFPGGIFPKAAIHEFISLSAEDAASTNGFIAVVLSKLMLESGCSLWISNRRKLFPPALKSFGVDPERLLFVDTSKTKDALWAIEEALKCDAICAVVGEIRELNFNESRRLQLAVEQSRVTGFIHRFQPRTENVLACASRWKINKISSANLDTMPGVGFPRWDVNLTKVRNGKPGQWQMQWSPCGLEYVKEQTVITPQIFERQTG
jgi:protein ImuA